MFQKSLFGVNITVGYGVIWIPLKIKKSKNLKCENSFFVVNHDYIKYFLNLCKLIATYFFLKNGIGRVDEVSSSNDSVHLKKIEITFTEK